MSHMIKIVSDGTWHGTHFFDLDGEELHELRKCCRSVRWEHQAGETPVATLEIFAALEVKVKVKKHVLDEMVDRANHG